MEMVVAQGERQEMVVVRREADGFTVSVGETTYHVNSVPVGPGRSTLLIAAEQYEVSVRAAGEGRYRVGAGNGHAETDGLVEVLDPLAHLARASRGGASAGGLQQVAAYMPGQVKEVLAAEGDEVTEGQGIVVLEAMKMENEIRAERAGVLRRLLVEPGQAVDTGDPLFEIE